MSHLKALPAWFCRQFHIDVLRGRAPRVVAEDPARPERHLYEARPALHAYRGQHYLGSALIPRGL